MLGSQGKSGKDLKWKQYPLVCFRNRKSDVVHFVKIIDSYSKVIMRWWFRLSRCRFLFSSIKLRNTLFWPFHLQWYASDFILILRFWFLNWIELNSLPSMSRNQFLKFEKGWYNPKSNGRKWCILILLLKFCKCWDVSVILLSLVQL